MLIPLIPKDPDLTDFSCRDGEIDFIAASEPGASPTPATTPYPLPTPTLTPEGAEPSLNIRIPLQSGDRPKAELMLSGDISRVDPETADRITQAIVRKAAENLLDLSTDLRRQGLFILPFRFMTLTQTPQGTLSYPGPQGVALPTDRPPHPEITAAAATDDALTLAIRFPVRPHRLTVVTPATLPAGYTLRTCISYPLYIPDPKEMRGSIGSVRSASGANATGIRFAFLSSSAIKASVAAPEKYHEMAGNTRTGYRLSSRAADTPGYSCYADILGYVPPFPRDTLLALGHGVDPDTDPMDWIADWRRATDPLDNTKEGYLPVSLPYIYFNPESSGTARTLWPEGLDRDAVMAAARSMGCSRVLLTRPMTLANDAVSRRHAAPTAIRAIRVLALGPGSPAHAILYGSDDCVRWTPLRRFDPRRLTSVLSPPRLFWRLLVMYGDECRPEAVFLKTGVL